MLGHKVLKPVNKRTFGVQTYKTAQFATKIKTSFQMTNVNNLWHLIFHILFCKYFKMLFKMINGISKKPFLLSLYQTAKRKSSPQITDER